MDQVPWGVYVMRLVPDAESFDKHDYVGLAAETAWEHAEQRGWKPRRIAPDMVVTLEFKAGRLNLFVDEDDQVVDASIG